MIWLFLAACTEKQQAEQEVDLIDMASWAMIDLDEDIVQEHQPAEVECDISAFSLEIDQLEIQTDYCNYAAIAFETQKDIPAGTMLEALVLHTGLWALEAAEAHFAFYLNGELFWEETRPIPSDTEFFFTEQKISQELPKGSQLYFHLHNHGANDWKLGYFREVE